MKELKLVVLFFVCCLGLAAQEKTSGELEKPKYDRKEEIIYDGKRYRIHNNYLTIGGGFVQSSIRHNLQKGLGIDFHFPIKRLNFQVGVLMSGEEFASNNNVQGHVCYGFRKEKSKNNLAAYIGPSFFTGVEGNAAGQPHFYQGVGAYISLQAVTKLTYDIGVGIELFGEISAKQNLAGLKIIAFFSSAFRGQKKNFNPNVRSENPK